MMKFVSRSIDFFLPSSHSPTLEYLNMFLDGVVLPRSLTLTPELWHSPWKIKREQSQETKILSEPKQKKMTSCTLSLTTVRGRRMAKVTLLYRKVKPLSKKGRSNSLTGNLLSDNDPLPDPTNRREPKIQRSTDQPPSRHTCYPGDPNVTFPLF